MEPHKKQTRSKRRPKRDHHARSFPEIIGRWDGGRNGVTLADVRTIRFEKNQPTEKLATSELECGWNHCFVYHEYKFALTQNEEQNYEFQFDIYTVYDAYKSNTIRQRRNLGDGWAL